MWYQIAQEPAALSGPVRVTLCVQHGVAVVSSSECNEVRVEEGGWIGVRKSYGLSKRVLTQDKE
jgi:hypothetical protein